MLLAFVFNQKHLELLSISVWALVCRASTPQVRDGLPGAIALPSRRHVLPGHAAGAGAARTAQSGSGETAFEGGQREEPGRAAWAAVTHISGSGLRCCLHHPLTGAVPRATRAASRETRGLRHVRVAEELVRGGTIHVLVRNAAKAHESLQ